MRTLVIGDIHGAYLALVDVLEKAQVTETDTLIFLGDYVDGWSGTVEVIEKLIQLNETNPCVFIKGNHDEWCEKWLQTNESNPTWLFHGGSSTVASYSTISETQKKTHLEFFNRMKDYYVDAENNLFIHAGYTSMHGPEKETHDSNYRWDRTLWEMAVAMDNRVQKNAAVYPKRLKLYKEIYIGHTPTIHYDVEEPMNAVNVWNIDTGAAFTGKLSILDIHTKEFWQSENVQKLYPDEKGRNKD